MAVKTEVWPCQLCTEVWDEKHLTSGSQGDVCNRCIAEYTGLVRAKPATEQPHFTVPD